MGRGSSGNAGSGRPANSRGGAASVASAEKTFTKAINDAIDMAESSYKGYAKRIAKEIANSVDIEPYKKAMANAVEHFKGNNTALDRLIEDGKGAATPEESLATVMSLYENGFYDKKRAKNAYESSIASYVHFAWSKVFAAAKKKK